MREFAHDWTCPGCGQRYDLVTKVDEKVLERSFNPAPIVAAEKLTTQRIAVARHTQKGCKRPV